MYYADWVFISNTMTRLYIITCHILHFKARHHLLFCFIEGNNTNRYALIYDSTVVEYASRTPPCTTRVLGNTIRPMGYGLALAKNSPYTRLFDSEILKMKESGYLELLALNWIQGPCPESGKYEQEAGQTMQRSTC